MIDVPFSLQKPEHTYETGYVEELVRNEEPAKEVTKPVEAPKTDEPKSSLGSIVGWVLLAAVLLALGYLQVRRIRRC